MTDLVAGSTVRILVGEYRYSEAVVLAVYPRRFLVWRWQVASVRVIGTRIDGSPFPKENFTSNHLQVLSVPIADPRNTVTVREGDPETGAVW